MILNYFLAFIIFDFSLEIWELILFFEYRLLILSKEQQPLCARTVRSCKRRPEGLLWLLRSDTAALTLDKTTKHLTRDKIIHYGYFLLFHLQSTWNMIILPG